MSAWYNNMASIALPWICKGSILASKRWFHFQLGTTIDGVIDGVYIIYGTTHPRQVRYHGCARYHGYANVKLYRSHCMT